MFELSRDQRALAAVARQFADEFVAPNALAWDRTKTFPIDTLRQAGELGMGGMYIRDDVGGSGLSRLDSALIVEALATGCPSLASYISIHNMVAWMIDHYGTADQRAEHLPAMCSMTVLGSYCLTEPGAGSDAAALITRAEAHGEHWILNGVKQFISGAGTSGIYLVLARTSAEGADGITAFLVPAGTPGLSFGPNEAKMGWNCQPTRQVVLTDVEVHAGNVLGVVGQGFRIAMSGLNGGRVNIGASSVGGAQFALDRAIAYMSERHAFGAPLSHLQALQFRVADMATDLEGARLMLWRAASAIDANDPDAVKWCAMAKRQATEVGFNVANSALQIHGGYGYLAEYGIEKIVRDLRVHQILEGTNEIMQLVVARALVGT